MRPAEFTPETIIKAGQELRVVGRNITGFALRQKVGGGNPTRLKQVWDEYINSQATAKTEPLAELPIEVAEELSAVTKALTERLAALAVELNDKAVKAAERRVHEVVRAAGEQREQAVRELADASQTVEDLETALDRATGTITGLEKKLGESQASNQAQAIEFAQISERLALTEQASQEQRKTSAQEAHRTADRMTQAKAERDNARKEVSIVREEVAKLRGQVEILQIQIANQLRAFDSHQGRSEKDASPEEKK